MTQYDLFSKRTVIGIEFQAAGQSGKLLAMFAEAAGLKVQVCAYMLDPRQCYVDFASNDRTTKFVSPIKGDGYHFQRVPVMLGAASHTLEGALNDLFESCAKVDIFVEVIEKDKPQVDYYRIKSTGYLKYQERDFVKLIN